MKQVKRKGWNRKSNSEQNSYRQNKESLNLLWVKPTRKAETREIRKVYKNDTFFGTSNALFAKLKVSTPESCALFSTKLEPETSGTHVTGSMLW